MLTSSNYLFVKFAATLLVGFTIGYGFANPKNEQLQSQLTGTEVNRIGYAESNPACTKLPTERNASLSHAIDTSVIAPELKKTHNEELGLSTHTPTSIAPTSIAPTSKEVTGTDDSSAEQAILAIESNESKISQGSDELLADIDLIEPLYDMDEQAQLAYIKKLANSNDDSSVTALSDLMLYDDPKVQAAAIDSLISLLELNTGHFPVVTRMLEQNSAFLDEIQLKKIQQIRDSLATPSRTESPFPS